MFRVPRQKEPCLSHFTRAGALALIKKLDVPTAYLINISHRLSLPAEVEKELPPNVHLACDRLVLEL